MSKIPADYLQRVYAGWLGKIIGIRHGAPIEGWTYEKIRDIVGEIDSYPVDYREFAADDDSNGPLFFLRGLETAKDSGPYPAAGRGAGAAQLRALRARLLLVGRLRHFHRAYRLSEPSRGRSRAP